MLYFKTSHNSINLSNFFQPSRIEFIYFFKHRNFRILKKFKKVRSFFRILSNRDFFDLIKKIAKRGLSNRYRLFLVRAVREFNRKFSLKKKKFIDLFLTNSKIFEFFQVFLKFNIFFKFSFHAVNKKVRKYSRGRSGKYKTVFNYIPKFKRKNQIFKIFTKNLKIIKEVNFFKKLLNLVLLTKRSPELTLFYKFKIFADTHVHRNKYRSVLLNSN